ncbi:hypothetical protein RCL1_008128 [Eukaryota sp. TZLM3-RCL]
MHSPRPLKDIIQYRMVVTEKGIPIVRFFSNEPSIQFIYDPNFATSSTLLSFFDTIECRLDLFELEPQLKGDLGDIIDTGARVISLKTLNNLIVPVFEDLSTIPQPLSTSIVTQFAKSELIRSIDDLDHRFTAYTELKNSYADSVCDSGDYETLLCSSIASTFKSICDKSFVLIGCMKNLPEIPDVMNHAHHYLLVLSSISFSNLVRFVNDSHCRDTFMSKVIEEIDYGERLYPIVSDLLKTKYARDPEMAGMIVGMFLQLPIGDIRRLLYNGDLLHDAIIEALEMVDRSIEDANYGERLYFIVYELLQTKYNRDPEMAKLIVGMFCHLSIENIQTLLADRDILHENIIEALEAIDEAR